VGALLVEENDEVLVIMEGGKVMRALVNEVPAKGRDTMGVIFAKPGKDDKIIGIAHNVERHLDVDEPLDADATVAPDADATVAPDADADAPEVEPTP
jgi:DNA gyrase subunit A